MNIGWDRANPIFIAEWLFYPIRQFLENAGASAARLREPTDIVTQQPARIIKNGAYSNKIKRTRKSSPFLLSLYEIFFIPNEEGIDNINLAPIIGIAADIIIENRLYLC